MDTDILRKLAEQVDVSVFISGTNGKTTTSNLIGHTLKANNIEIIDARREYGCRYNFAFIMIQHEDVNRGNPKKLMKGSIPRVLKEVTPSMMVFTNFFRDQMDRFGEIVLWLITLQRQLVIKASNYC